MNIDRSNNKAPQLLLTVQRLDTLIEGIYLLLCEIRTIFTYKVQYQINIRLVFSSTLNNFNDPEFYYNNGSQVKGKQIAVVLSEECSREKIALVRANRLYYLVKETAGRK